MNLNFNGTQHAVAKRPVFGKGSNIASGMTSMEELNQKTKELYPKVLREMRESQTGLLREPNDPMSVAIQRAQSAIFNERNKPDSVKKLLSVHA